ncbi:MAG: hypothetical protein N2606_00175 [Candidatus Omnitrophica bacterium]|nr:hypothetical protein [Candidatus Omnitrophota bacterium]
MLALILILIGVFLRLIPHTPNFTPVAAVALFSGAFMKRRTAILIPLSLMVISDLILGLHEVVLFTWGSFIIITLLGAFLKEKKTLLLITAYSIVSSLIFFLITNLGVWLAGWYPPTFNGLITCYIMALPFLREFTVSTVLYSFIFFKVYEFLAYTVRRKNQLSVLLQEI